MEKPYLLHLMTPAKNASPFDVNMAYDAGWTSVIPYTQLLLEEVSGLVQDAIFSRGPKGVKRTGVFIGGRDMVLAMDMLENAQNAMMPPFEVSVFADPSGAFTTAAGLVACVEQQLHSQHGLELKGQRVVILGGTGPVGCAAAVLAARAGAETVILGREKDKADRIAALCNHSYGAQMTGIKGDASEQKGDQLKHADVVLSTAAAGVQVMSEDDIRSASKLKVVADINAVPPAGIEGVGLMDDGTPLPSSETGAVGIGALAVGNVKYQVQQQMLEQMRVSDKAVYLHFEQAFEHARVIVAKR